MAGLDRSCPWLNDLIWSDQRFLDREIYVYGIGKRSECNYRVVVAGEDMLGWLVLRII